MKNELPKKIPALLTLAGEAAAGAGTHGATIPLLVNTQANITADVNPVLDALAAYGAAKSVLKARHGVVQEKTKVGRLFLTVSRDSFKPTLGFEYNRLWDETGLEGSLGITALDSVVLPLLKSFERFMTDHPEMEVAAKNITADRASELFEELKAARILVNEQQNVLSDALALRNTRVRALRTRVRGLINELAQKMGPLDNRWLAFGLNKPGAAETPDPVQNLVATVIGPGVVAMKWDAAARAKYYHVYKKVLGVDVAPVLVGSPADIDFNLEGLPAGKTIEIYVTAVNTGGDGVKSNVVTLTTHP
jgi:hypothetical protein